MNQIKQKTDELKNFWNDEEKIKKVEKTIINEEIEIKTVKEKTIVTEQIKETPREIKLNLDYKDYTKEDNKKYKPTYLLIQIILNIALATIAIILDSYIFIFIIILNFVLVWLYSLISILKNDFIKESNKISWLIALIFIPIITPFLYLDLKEIHTK